MGLVLNSGFDETAYVAEVVAGGNAEAEGTLRVGDVLLSCGARDCDFDVPGSKFDDVMDALGANPDASVMNLRGALTGEGEPSPRGTSGWRRTRRRRVSRCCRAAYNTRCCSGARGRARPRRTRRARVLRARSSTAPSSTSYRRGKPSTFAPRQVIKGWTEAMQLMKEGDKWELYVPAELGYGGRGSPSGSIKPGDALVFTIEIVSIQG